MVFVVQVATPIYKVTSFTEISIWFIVGGVIGGLLALVIIAVILKKVPEILLPLAAFQKFPIFSNLLSKFLHIYRWFFFLLYIVLYYKIAVCP